MEPEVIFKTQFGSHLYGTSTPYSDFDIKGIYLPQTREILLQRIQPLIAIEARKRIPGEKNTPFDIDHELYSLEKFLSLLAEGQTVALDMLFAPKEALLSPIHPIWEEIKILAPQIFTKKSISFVRYCKQQANRYGMKGLRIAAVKRALEVLKSLEKYYGSSSALIAGINELKHLGEGCKFISIGDSITLANGEKAMYLEVCGRKAILNAPIKSAIGMVQKIMDEYATRTLAAEKNLGADWKALSHAVRIGYQGIEFLKNGHITFPRPEAKHLIAIKEGKVPLEKVEEEIEELFIEVEAAAKHSRLPEEFDQNIIDNFIEKIYLRQILKGLKK
ncbi:MAG: hypothetical protein K0S74_1029 [Chlamydiales bacterium]|jgi:predicted nucleotidyltransferase|nr:hypothetical protein [Chlamydiales bacterium]